MAENACVFATVYEAAVTLVLVCRTRFLSAPSDP